MISEILKTLRKEKNWSQWYVSYRIYVSRSTYTQYELGYRKKPIPDETLKRIAQLYKIELTELKKTA